ncbi:hypothetical protein HYFRA_00001327 [Hymenoscyphus fraxineus]|uniref:Uncharacterized protein n=1 Tax=Hymenoscyphus fraxineus TaxID=746836 RepID=A0A9N9L4P8_9HELO|nr:hypothetical protein HYFRA_00001327 [Hymenoscyphus fraxineus]
MHLPRTLLLTLASSSLASTQQTTSPTTTTLTTLSPFFNPWNPGPVLPFPSQTTEAESPAEPTTTPPLTTFATLPSPSLSPSATSRSVEDVEMLVGQTKEQSRNTDPEGKMWKFRNFAKALGRRGSGIWNPEPCFWCWDWFRWGHTSSSASTPTSTSTSTATATESPEPVETLAKRSPQAWLPPYPYPLTWDEWKKSFESWASYESMMLTRTTLSTSIPAATASPEPVETITKRSTKDWYPRPVDPLWVPGLDWDEWNDLLKSIASQQFEPSTQTTTLSTSIPAATASPEPVETITKRSTKDWYPRPVDPLWVPGLDWDEWNDLLKSIASQQFEPSTQTTTLSTSIPAATASPEPVETITKRSTKDWYPRPVDPLWVPGLDWDEWNDLLKSIASQQFEPSTQTTTLSTSIPAATASPEPVDTLAKRSTRDWYPHPIPAPLVPTSDWDEWNDLFKSIASHRSDISTQTTTLSTSTSTATAISQPVDTPTKRSTKDWYPHFDPPLVPKFDWDEFDDRFKFIASHRSEISTQTTTTPNTLPTSQPQSTEPTTSSPQPVDTPTKRSTKDWYPHFDPPLAPKFGWGKYNDLLKEFLASHRSDISTQTTTTATTPSTPQVQSTEPTTPLNPQNRRDEPSPASASVETPSTSSTPTPSFPSSLYTHTSPQQNWDSMISRLQNFDASASPTTSSSKSSTRGAKSFATVTKRGEEMQETSHVVNGTECSEGEEEGEEEGESRMEMKKRDYFGGESGGHRVMYCPGWPTATRHNLTHFKIWHFRCFCTRYYKIERQDCSYGWAPGQFTEF